MLYNYIIVGAGSAGCVLANRLTENPNTRVLLLEAGKPDRERSIHIPIAFRALSRTEYDWSYYTQPQSNLNNRKLFWPRGKVLGGCSSINAMIYIRGHRWNYDHWHELGNKGWSFSEVLPYFKKAENQERGASEYHGTDGPLNVANLRYTNPLSQAFVEAATEIGLENTKDFNCPEPEGVGFYQVTQKNGKRHSTAVAYLKPCRHRANLTIRTGAQVTRLLLDGTRVTGVEYILDGGATEIEKLTTTSGHQGEVILCGGAINSPQLLMLSGIGPADHLKALGIPVVVNLPGVGQNLQDHLWAGVVYECTQPITLEGANTTGNLLKYLLFKRGPLTSNIAEAGGFVKTTPDLTKPDLQLHFAPVFLSRQNVKPMEGNYFTLFATLLHPQSRGYIRLSSPNPLVAPLIQPNYLTDQTDLQVLLTGIKLCRQILQASAFETFRGEELFPGTQVEQLDEIATYIRDSAGTLYHPVGTCKMGNDPMAVVNSRLQVHSIEGLRVVDASIMPTIVGGNTNAPTIMIAEKAADLLMAEEPTTLRN
ncbi:choline dehydrogenase [Moorena sp. SIO4G3]|uniref:GMC family oxidoreductase n=1 Tax=Moorena sp. SIO4G3 TaxID=2607821 RepID=UPI00142CEC38|nr:choline dehydrogenase [Moorena sp. SIO4G3]NEO77413.1 choline dehydrogenase [Moorena sp. SIO4G3]